MKYAWEVVNKTRDLMRSNERGYWRPMELARHIGATRAEVELALWYMRRDYDDVKRRDDGRWYMARAVSA